MKTKMRKNLRPALFALAGLGLLSPLVIGVLVFLALNLQWLSKDQIGIAVSVLALVVSIYVAIFSGFISWKALVFGALPRIDVSLYMLSGKKTDHLAAGEPSTLRFKLTNIGWWYAKPASTNTKCYVNVDPAFDLKHANYGNNLELIEKKVRRGKRNSKYFIIRGIHLYPVEQGEEIAVALTAPAEPGTYDVWISATSDQCDHGTFQFSTKVVSESIKLTEPNNGMIVPR